ncbi:unnamed protein product [Pedinophyceae sp. YPF-701]|nr:unnamed protein product [Pedinophyceae sp. YPF-701]
MGNACVKNQNPNEDIKTEKLDHVGPLRSVRQLSSVSGGGLQTAATMDSDSAPQPRASMACINSSAALEEKLGLAIQRYISTHDTQVKTLNQMMLLMPQITEGFHECEDLFRDCDVDRDGRLNLQEFLGAPGLLSSGVTLRELRELFAEVDLQHTTKITIREFLALLTLFHILDVTDQGGGVLTPEADAPVPTTPSGRVPAIAKDSLRNSLDLAIWSYLLFDAEQKGFVTQSDVTTTLAEIGVRAPVGPQSSVGAGVPRSSNITDAGAAPTSLVPSSLRVGSRGQSTVSVDKGPRSVGAGSRSSMQEVCEQRFKEMTHSSSDKVTFVDFVISLGSWCGIEESDGEYEDPNNSSNSVHGPVRRIFRRRRTPTASTPKPQPAYSILKGGRQSTGGDEERRRRRRRRSLAAQRQASQRSQSAGGEKAIGGRSVSMGAKGGQKAGNGTQPEDAVGSGARAMPRITSGDYEDDEGEAKATSRV